MVAGNPNGRTDCHCGDSVTAGTHVAQVMDTRRPRLHCEFTLSSHFGEQSGRELSRGSTRLKPQFRDRGTAREARAPVPLGGGASSGAGNVRWWLPCGCLVSWEEAASWQVRLPTGGPGSVVSLVRWPLCPQCGRTWSTSRPCPPTSGGAASMRLWAANGDFFTSASQLL